MLRTLRLALLCGLLCSMRGALYGAEPKAAAAAEKLRAATDVERKEIAGMLDKFRLAVVEGAGAKVSALFDCQRTMVALKDQGGLAGADLGTILGLRIGLESMIRFGPAALVEHLTWSSHRLGSVRVDTDARRAVVCLRINDEDDFAYWFRIWLIKHESGWKAFDFEFVDSAIRLTQQISETTATLPTREAELEKAQLLVEEAFDEVDYQNPEEAREALAKADRLDLQSNLLARRWLCAARLALLDDDPQAALDAITKVRELNGDFATLDRIAAQAHQLRGQHAAAVTAGRRSLDVLGGDSETHALIGKSLLAQKMKSEAAAAFRAGLAEEPHGLPCLIGLGQTLPKDNKQELAQHFAKIENQQEHFESIVSEFWVEDDVAAMDVIIAEFRQKFPDDVNADYYDAMARNIEGKPKQAAEILRRALGKISPDHEEYEYYLTEYLDAMTEAGSLLEAYRTAPAAEEAFKHLIGRLQDEEDTKQARELIAAHRQRCPEDLWAFYYLGEAESQDGNLQKAEAAYREGMRFTLNTEILAQFRSARVAAYAKAGKALEAYNSIRPRRETFLQLAAKLLDADDFKTFEELVATHREADPRDAQLALWEAEAAWRKKDYRRAVDILRRNRVAILDQVEDGLWEYEERMVRGLIRTRQFGEALALAQTSTARDDDPWYLVMVHVARGDSASALRYAKVCVDEMGYEPTYFYDDEDMGPVLKSDAFKPFRDVYPPGPKPVYEAADSEE